VKSVSKQRKNKVVNQIAQITKASNQGASATRRAHSERMNDIINELHSKGFKVGDLRGLNDKHVHALVALWKEKGISGQVQANRMSTIRKYTYAVANHSISKSNDKYNLTPKQKNLNDPARIELAKKITVQDIARIRPEHKEVQLSYELALRFGLRKEESILFEPKKCIIRDKYSNEIKSIYLRDGITKGSRPREIQIRTNEQRELIERIDKHCKDNGLKKLIPLGKTAKQQYIKAEYERKLADLPNFHSMRHQYARDRFHELTGHEVPILDSTYRAKNMTERERQEYDIACDIISHDTGHSREDVVRNYIGNIHKP